MTGSAEAIMFDNVTQVLPPGIPKKISSIEDDWELEDPPQFLPFWFEDFDRKWWLKFSRECWWLSVVASVVYIIVIFSVQAFMKNRPAFKLKKALFLWNATLGIFSIFGFIRFIPEFMRVLSNSGVHGILCHREGLNMPLAYWSLLFTLSKYVELGDTVFIVLRKRPLVFLQWYHHAITLNAAWNMVGFLEPLSRLLAFLNYGVHSVMYPYFALKAIDVHIPKRIANCITVAQLTQMIVGLIVNIYTGVVYSYGGDCLRHPTSVKMFVTVYGSFTILFGDLLYKAMFATRRKTIKAE